MIRSALKVALEKIHYTLGNTLERRWNTNPFGSSPHGTREVYDVLREEAVARRSSEVIALESEIGFALDLDWMAALAGQTQITIKKSEISLDHGPLLYAYLRRYCEDRPREHICVLETGTARGFSGVCMAKALCDSPVSGSVITLDVLPNNVPMYWNCRADHDGKHTRQELLSAWPEELKRMVFIQGDTVFSLRHLGLLRVNFAFLDAQHTEAAVLDEYQYVSKRQIAGDLIVFDDVTPEVFPGVVSAVDKVEREALYQVHRITASNNRGYAIAIKR